MNALRRLLNAVRRWERASVADDPLDHADSHRDHAPHQPLPPEAAQHPGAGPWSQPPGT